VVTVGLTGGIGAGKSTVSRLLASYGAVVVDADALAREAVAPGTPGLAQVVAEFGPEVLAPDGSLDRTRLGRQVFAEPEQLARLNDIIHPYVAARRDEVLAQAPAGAVVVVDVPLLVEIGRQDDYDVVVVVDASEQSQLRRLVEGRGMEEEQARARMAAQASREQRLAAADVVISNDGDLDALRSQVERLWADLRARVATEDPGTVGGATYG
jgi:dephospho-CoA kinase